MSGRTWWSRAAAIFILSLLISTRWLFATGMANISLDDSIDEHCVRLHCSPHSACQVTFHAGIATAECVCAKGWIGRRCQGRLNISIVSSTMTSVTLRISSVVPVDSVTADTDQAAANVSKDNTNETTESNHTLEQSYSYLDAVGPEAIQLLSYSIHYWASKQSFVCNIVPVYSKPEVEVSGLLANTQYTFCAKTSPHDWCDFGLVNTYVNHSSALPCISIWTADSHPQIDIIEPPKPGVPSYVIAVAVASVVVALITLISILAISVRKGYFMRTTFAKRKRRRKQNLDNTSGEPFLDSAIEMLLLNSPKTNKQVVVNPPNQPGKPKHQLVNKTKRGYASFTAVNEQTIALSTVIEYGSQEDIAVSDTGDAELESVSEEHNELTESENESLDADQERLREILS